jgi:hypothetical protein
VVEYANRTQAWVQDYSVDGLAPDGGEPAAWRDPMAGRVSLRRLNRVLSVLLCVLLLESSPALAGPTASPPRTTAGGPAAPATTPPQTSAAGQPFGFLQDGFSVGRFWTMDALEGDLSPIFGRISDGKTIRSSSRALARIAIGHTIRGIVPTAADRPRSHVPRMIGSPPWMSGMSAIRLWRLRSGLHNQPLAISWAAEGRLTEIGRYGKWSLMKRWFSAA